MGYGTRNDSGPVNTADRVAAFKSRRQQVEWCAPANPSRRKRLEKHGNEKLWLKYYLGATYTREFEKPHIEIIEGAVKASRTGGRFAVAAERGIGKSAVLWGIVLYLALTRQHRFPVCIPWQESAKKRAFRFWKSALCYNHRLLLDYPEICAPYAHSKGVPQRIITTIWGGGPRDGQLTGAQLNVGEGLIVLPDSIGCIGGSTINGNPRGLNHPQEDGTILRPTIVLLDDVQDRGVAKSSTQVTSTIEMIDGDVAGCGEPGRDMPMLMACNCIAKGDVSEHYLTNDMWKSLRIPCVVKFPKDWEDSASDCKKAWDELNTRILNSDTPVKFYKQNKKTITNGMVLSAPFAFKGAAHCPDAFYGVIRMYYQMGHDAFMAERQQSPVEQSTSIHNLTPQLIMVRSDPERDMGQIPGWVVEVVAATDVNPSYGFTTVVAGIGANQRTAVLWYGVYKLDIPSKNTDAQKISKIMLELEKHGKQLYGLPCKPSHWWIDGGGSPQETVINFCATSLRSVGIQAFCAYGRAWRQFRPKQQDRKFEQVFLRVESRSKRWVIWNVDYWKEIAQKAWTAAIGAPGSCDLPGGNHREFADQICREQLAGKAETAGTWVYVWNHNAGPHDYGDCMAMIYGLAAMVGIGTGGQVDTRVVRKKYKQSDFYRR